MATTTNRAYPYPAPTDAPDGPGAIFALAKKLDDEAGDAFIGWAGTCHDWSATFRTMVRRTAGVATFILNVDPGANGLSSQPVNSLICILPAGWKPLVAFTVDGPVYRGSGGPAWNGDKAVVQFNTDGTLAVQYVGTTSASIAGGSFLSLSASYPLAP